MNDRKLTMAVIQKGELGHDSCAVVNAENFIIHSVLTQGLANFDGIGGDFVIT